MYHMALGWIVMVKAAQPVYTVVPCQLLKNILIATKTRAKLCMKSRLSADTTVNASIGKCLNWMWLACTV